MSDDVTYQSGFEQPKPDGDQLRESVAELSELVRDAARRAAALDARIDSLPGPMEIASAVESEVERSVREARDVIDARVGSLGAELESLSRRLAEVSDALVPLEGLRTEIATVADESASFRDIRATLQTALEQLASGKVPTLDTAGPERVAAEVEARLDAFRRLLDETASQIRADFEVLVRGEQEASERRSDALGLRITNMSVGVTSTLEYLTQQAERIAERGRAIESENASILNAIRDQVEKMRSAVPRTASDDGAVVEAIKNVESRVRDIESRLSERMSSLEERVDRKAADTGLEEIRDQLNAVIAVLEAPTRDPMLQEVRDQLSSLTPAEQPARDPILEEIRAQLERLSAATPALPDDLVKQITARIDEISPSAQPSDGLLNEIRNEVFELRGELLELREHEVTPTDEMVAEVRQHLARISAPEQPARDPILDEIRAQLEGLRTPQLLEPDPILDEIRAQLADLIAAETPRDPILDEIRSQIAELPREPGASADEVVASAVEQLRAAFGEAVTGVQDALARSIGELSLRIDGVESKMVQLAGETSDALDGAAAQTAGGMQALRAALEKMTETGSVVEQIRQELEHAMESFSTQLVTRTASVRSAISERTGKLEQKLAALPPASDFVDAVVERLTPAIAAATQQDDERGAGIEHELGAVAANVNEIWIRVRAIVKKMDEERAAGEDEAARTVEQIEELTRGSERLGVQLLEAEQRLVQAMRAMETERDRAFLRSLNDVLERMPRRERKLFRKRARDVAPARSETTPPVTVAAAPAAPAVSPQRRFAPPVPAEGPPREARTAARAKPSPKLKPKPQPKAKAKPKPKPKPAGTAADKPKAKAKPKPKPAPRAPKQEPADVSPTAEPHTSEASPPVETKADASAPNTPAHAPEPPAPKPAPEASAESEKGA